MTAQVSKSDLLTVTIEFDDEWSPIIGAACQGVVPQFDGGFLHEPHCICTIDKLCDIGWLEEFVACAGELVLLDRVAMQSRQNYRWIILTGRMVAERFESIEFGNDFDEYFDVKNVDIVP